MSSNLDKREAPPPSSDSAAAVRNRKIRWTDSDPLANHPAGLYQLSPEQQTTLVEWVRAVLVPAKAVFRRSSYGMKRDFAREPDGFYIKSGAFKGAMLAAGFRPVDETAINWFFRVRPARRLDAFEKQARGVLGNSWLVRDRWREKGYLATTPTNRLRIAQHAKACRREGRVRLVLLQERHRSEVILDTRPARSALSGAAIREIEVLFRAIDPDGRRWSIRGSSLVSIRRIMPHEAEMVRDSLKRITEGDGILRADRGLRKGGGSMPDTPNSGSVEGTETHPPMLQGEKQSIIVAEPE